MVQVCSILLQCILLCHWPCVCVCVRHYFFCGMQLKSCKTPPAMTDRSAAQPANHRHARCLLWEVPFCVHVNEQWPTWRIAGTCATWHETSTTQGTICCMTPTTPLRSIKASVKDGAWSIKRVASAYRCDKGPWTKDCPELCEYFSIRSWPSWAFFSKISDFWSVKTPNTLAKLQTPMICLCLLKCKTRQNDTKWV